MTAPRPRVEPKTDSHGQRYYDVVAPAGFRFADGGSHVMVEWDRNDARALVGPLEPCPAECDCGDGPPPLMFEVVTRRQACGTLTTRYLCSGCVGALEDEEETVSKERTKVAACDRCGAS